MIDVVTTIASVALADDTVPLLPGVQNQLTLQINLTNNNEPDYNSEIAVVEASPGGDNYNLSLFVVDADMSVGLEVDFLLETVETTLVNGDLSSALNGTETISFSFLVDVGSLNMSLN